MVAANGPMMPIEVIMATVADPCATRTKAVAKKAITNKAYAEPLEGTHWANWLAMSVCRIIWPNAPPAAVMRITTPALDNAD